MKLKSTLKIVSAVLLLVALLAIVRNTYDSDSPIENNVPTTTDTTPQNITLATEVTEVTEGIETTEAPVVQEVDPSLWKDNVLMADDLDIEIPLGGYKSIVQIMPVFGFDVMRTQITAVIFENTTKNAPIDSKDVSATQNGSVLAWIDSDDGSMELHLAANGGINGKLACKDLFCGYYCVESIEFNNCFFTDEATDFSRMFYGCTYLDELDLTGISTENAVDVSEMFAKCWSLPSLDISDFDTSKVEDMSGMFSGCGLLTNLKLGEFATRNVKDISYMFQACPAAAALNIGDFDFSKVSSYGMFLDDGVLVNGRPWLELFDPTNIEETRGVDNVMWAGQWDTGRVSISIPSTDHISLSLKDEVFASEEFLTGEDDITIYLYHDEEEFHCYNTTIENREGELHCFSYYMFAMSAANSYHPKDAICSLQNDTLVLDIYANDLVRWDMDELEKIVIYHYSGAKKSSNILYSMDLN